MRAAPPFALKATRPRADLVDRLSARLQRLGLDGVLDDLDRAGEQCLVPGEAAGDGFTWDELDRSDPGWWPQGVASTRSGTVLLVSWYAKRGRLLRTPGSRISVVDRAHPDGPRYGHVLLVAPHRRLGVLTMGTVPVHAGGIAVHGDLLLVADTLFGVRVFRLGDLMAVPRRLTGTAGDASPTGIDALRRSAVGGSGSRGYDHVLPQLMAFRVPLRAGPRRLRYSFLSTGELEGRPTLAVGEYRAKDDRQPRLARYPLDPRTGLPAVDGHGLCVPLEVHEDQPRRMQGVAVHGSTWFVTASNGRGSAGDLYVGAPGTWHRNRGVLPSGPEDLAWSRPGEELWCVSEWPGRRWVFPVATDRH
ncbi:hypothetical protein IN07_04295 [Modestobacter caceresii]|uniref:Uncharacterized protein n=1 Tax=Modestobacter caceresii TaxID=1522368 RepID=A0A098YC80_9ACTN|nr:hypothetical protein [Modestobacter caceresii]KGH48072.1 hypothetical protein IN07_04295 [Modestobacter caceresii]